jgi:hypothetical protein
VPTPNYHDTACCQQQVINRSRVSVASISLVDSGSVCAWRVPHITTHSYFWITPCLRSINILPSTSLISASVGCSPKRRLCLLHTNWSCCHRYVLAQPACAVSWLYVLLALPACLHACLIWTMDYHCAVPQDCNRQGQCSRVLWTVRCSRAEYTHAGCARVCTLHAGLHSSNAMGGVPLPG